MTYTIVIVTYNRLQKLRRCIDCALAQLAAPAHIVIVDNASSDGTADYLRDLCLRDNRFVVLRTKTNTGGAGGFMRGMKKAADLHDDYMLLIDDDAYLRKDFMQHILSEAGRMPKVLAFAGSVYESGALSLNHRRRIHGSLYIRENPVPASEYKANSFYCDEISFCGFVVSTALVLKAGVARGDFFIWMDDTEYSLRIRKYTRIRVVTRAAIDHDTVTPDHMANALRFIPFSAKEYYSVRNLLVVTKKYFPGITYASRVAFIQLRIAKQALRRLTTNGDAKDEALYNELLLRTALRHGRKSVMDNHLYRDFT